MGYIKEPVGIDFVVDSTPLTTEDKEKIGEIIAFYKATRKKVPPRKSIITLRIKNTKKLAIA